MTCTCLSWPGPPSLCLSTVARPSRLGCPHSYIIFSGSNTSAGTKEPKGGKGSKIAACLPALWLVASWRLHILPGPLWGLFVPLLAPPSLTRCPADRAARPAQKLRPQSALTREKTPWKGNQHMLPFLSDPECSLKLPEDEPHSSKP